MKNIARLISAVTLALSLSLGAVLPATAATSQPAKQTSAGGNGIKISPVRTDLTVNPGASQTVNVSVQNVTDGPATFQALINDFVAGNNENGQPSLILDSNKFAPSHSLKRYISAIPNIALAAGETKQVAVKISVPTGAAGGGYFGAVRFAPVAAGQNGQNVTLSASVGSLILVKVPGNIVDNLSITSLDVRDSNSANSASSFFTKNKPLVGMVRFQNKGNVQEQPFGKIVLKKGNKILQTSEINSSDPKGNVLPDSIRRFSVPLTKVGSFGKYTIEGNFGYGSNGQLLSANSTFYVVPVPIIATIIVLIILIIGAIILVPRAIKNYNKRILRKAGRR